MLQLLRLDDAAKWIIRPRANSRVAASQFCPANRGPMHRDDPKLISVIKQEITKFSLANTSRVCQHGLKHRLQLARRARDDLQYL